MLILSVHIYVCVCVHVLDTQLAIFFSFYPFCRVDPPQKEE